LPLKLYVISLSYCFLKKTAKFSLLSLCTSEIQTFSSALLLEYRQSMQSFHFGEPNFTPTQNNGNFFIYISMSGISVVDEKTILWILRWQALSPYKQSLKSL
jgi:hypothetical protein